jgi:hypothetical protein
MLLDVEWSLERSVFAYREVTIIAVVKQPYLTALCPNQDLLACLLDPVFVPAGSPLTAMYVAGTCNRSAGTDEHGTQSSKPTL